MGKTTSAVQACEGMRSFSFPRDGVERLPPGGWTGIRHGVSRDTCIHPQIVALNTSGQKRSCRQGEGPAGTTSCPRCSRVRPLAPSGRDGPTSGGAETWNAATCSRTGMVLALGGLLPAAGTAKAAANTKRGLLLNGVAGSTVNRAGQAGTFTGSSILVKRLGFDAETRTLKGSTAWSAAPPAPPGEVVNQRFAAIANPDPGARQARRWPCAAILDPGARAAAPEPARAGDRPEQGRAHHHRHNGDAARRPAAAPSPACSTRAWARSA